MARYQPAWDSLTANTNILGCPVAERLEADFPGVKNRLEAERVFSGGKKRVFLQQDTAVRFYLGRPREEID